MRRFAAVTALAVLVVAGLSCGKDPVGPRPGTLLVRLTTPNSGADSAIVLTIEGPAGLASATAGTGLRLFQQPLGATTTRFALTGTLTANATILTIGVADVNQVSQYSGTIQGVAQPNYQLRSLNGYSLAVTR